MSRELDALRDLVTCPVCGGKGLGHAQRACMKNEIERLRAELAELRKPDCRACAFYYACVIEQHEICIAGAGFDYARDPVRLYEREEK